MTDSQPLGQPNQLLWVSLDVIHCADTARKALRRVPVVPGTFRALAADPSGGFRLGFSVKPGPRVVA
jgi:hypothetical protein